VFIKKQHVLTEAIPFCINKFV